MIVGGSIPAATYRLGLAAVIGALFLPPGASAEIIRQTDGRSAPAEVAAVAVRPPAGPINIRVQPSLDRSAIRKLVDEVATRVGLDPKLAHAVVHTESNYRPFAISPRGAVGLMQIMPALVHQYGLEDPFDPTRNLEVGMRHLRNLLQRFDIRGALAAYNAGEGAVTRYGGVPPYRETEDYVRRILAAIR